MKIDDNQVKAIPITDTKAINDHMIKYLESKLKQNYNRSDELKMIYYKAMNENISKGR